MTPEDVLNKLAKWRTVFASWQLGTRSDSDPECKAVKDHREVTMLLRAEVNALAILLIEKGVVSQEEWISRLCREAELLDKQYEKKFPGFKTSTSGVHIDIAKAAETMRGWRP